MLSLPCRSFCYPPRRFADAPDASSRDERLPVPGSLWSGHVRMNPIDSDKNFIDKHLAGVLNRRRADESKPVATKKPAGYKNLQVIALAELHRDIHGVCQYRDAFVQADAARDLRRRRARADGNDVAISHQFRSN